MEGYSNDTAYFQLRSEQQQWSAPEAAAANELTGQALAELAQEQESAAEPTT